MFQQTFVDLEREAVKPYSVLVSLIVQIAALCMLILVPLLYTQTLPNAQLKSMLMAPAPPLPRPVAASRTRPIATSAHPLFARLVAPRVIPRQITSVNDIPSAPDVSSVAAAADGTALNGSLLFASNGASGTAFPPPPAPVKPQSVKPMRIGGVVASANLIHRVEPGYPPLARSARVQGSVEFTALIGKEGRVENLQLVRGHPLLVNAAKSAILQWQYHPTLLNGQAVEVLTSITVNFKLSD